MERWARIDAAPPDEARALLRTCCGSRRWVERMMNRRPFGARDSALSAAREEWFALSPDDWGEAFAHHPKIGARTASAISAREQSGTARASDDVLSQLAEANREYEDRFGYIFIVCATGKSAEEMLGLLRDRLENDPATELRVAAEEHAKICELRLHGEA